MAKSFLSRNKGTLRTAVLAIAVVVALVSGVALATLARAEPLGSTPAANPDSR